MEIFRYRNLALGCASFLLSLYISYFCSSTAKIVVLIASLLVLFVLVILLIIRKQGVLNLLIKYAPLFVFLSLAMIVSLIFFNPQKDEILLDGESHKIEASVEKVEFERNYQSEYIVKIERVDNEMHKTKAVLKIEGRELNKNDTFVADVTFLPFENAKIGFNERTKYLDDGITISAIAKDYDIITEGNDNLTLFEKLNLNLSSIFLENMDESSGALLSALILGNDHLLDNTIKRDCQRVGVSHALALSGMHLTIIVLLIGFLVGLLPIPIIIRNLLIIGCIIFFVVLTGFSESAIRAGLMLTIFHIIKSVGYRTDNITSLFMSVTIICAIIPSFIFSVSLMLSFFALLGCLIASHIIYKTRLRRTKFKVVRFVLFSLITTFFVISITMPIVSDVFGSFSLMTPISNLILVPIFTFLIYLGPFILLLSGVPYVSSALFFVGERVSNWLIYLIEKMAEPNGILIPIYSVIQKVGIVLIIVALVAIMISKRKHLKYAVISLCACSLVFVSGCFINYIDKLNNTYISTYNYKTSDFIAIEQEGKLTVVDISTTTTGVASYSLGFIDYLNNTEVENYIICDYSHLTDRYFDSVSGRIKIENLYLPDPQSEAEKKNYREIEKIAKKDKISLLSLENNLEIRGIRLDFASIDTLSRSERRSVSLNISKENYDFLYLGASSYEIFDYFTKDNSYMADVVVFGSYGPVYKKEYYYEIPNASYLVFCGYSYDYARGDLIARNEERIIRTKDEPIRFKLKS